MGAQEWALGGGALSPGALSPGALSAGAQIRDRRLERVSVSRIGTQ
ncbi:protein of unknown function [Agreia sp. COWG]|nr:protein of unknown function [Agreia sp. COWG]